MRLLADLRAMLRDIGSDEYKTFERVLDSRESQIKATESPVPHAITPAPDCGA